MGNSNRLLFVFRLLTVLLVVASSTVSPWRIAAHRVLTLSRLREKLFMTNADDSDSPNDNTDSNTTAAKKTASPLMTAQRKHVALLLGVRPTMANAPKWLYRKAWRIHDALLPLLHWKDGTVENKNALKVLWCKAITSIDPQSICQDDQWTYDMMPDYSRWWILKFVPVALYPRLHHANVEYRTVFLNRSIQQEMARLPASTKIRLVAIGAGYDVRTTRMLSLNSRVEEAWELDLPVVIDAKRALLQRLEERRKDIKGAVELPELRHVDLNDLDAVKAIVNEFPRNKKHGESWHTIYVIEGVMMFLEDGKPKEIFSLLKEMAKVNGENASICFADHLTSSSFENGSSLTDEQEREMVQSLFRSAGWEYLVDWAVKPGKARQMGCVRIQEY